MDDLIVVTITCCGSRHTVCMSDEGCLYSFGRNTEGQLGLSHMNDEKIPKPIASLSHIVALSCGENFTVCADSKGNVFSFGENNYGQLGLGHTANQHTPQKISGIPPISAVHCGRFHTFCLDQAQKMWSFGGNISGQLGQGHTRSPITSPQQVPFQNVHKIACGGEFTIIQDHEGILFACGENYFGQLGFKHAGNCAPEPQLVQIPGLRDISDFSCGSDHSVFLNTSGDIFSVGRNDDGQLGLGNKDNQSFPRKVDGLQKYCLISCGYYHTMCVDENGCLWTFGSNIYGQLGFEMGHEKDNYRIRPTKVNGLWKVKSLSIGSAANCCVAQCEDNSLWTFGYNDSAHLEFPDKNQEETAKHLPINSLKFLINAPNILNLLVANINAQKIHDAQKPPH